MFKKYGLKLGTPTNRVMKKRYDTLLTKEPTTIEWLNTLTKDDILFDIGANIGLYSLIAAKKRGCQVFSFEPQALNYAELCQNIILNNLSDKIKAYCLAITDEISFSSLFINEFITGQSHNDFQEQRTGKISHGCIGFTLDCLIENHYFPQPTHIKIDVDGYEHKVIYGMKDNCILKSMLIEIDSRIPEHITLVKHLVDTGWGYDIKQVERSLPSSQDENNFIFFRGSQ